MGNKKYNERKELGIPSSLRAKSQETVNAYIQYSNTFENSKIAEKMALGKELTYKERESAITDLQNRNKFMYGDFAGSFIKEEKQQLRNDLKSGNYKDFFSKGTTPAFDERARDAQFDRWKHGIDKPPKFISKAIANESKILVPDVENRSLTSSAGWASWKLQFLYGYSPEEARAKVRAKQRRDDPNEIYGSPEIW